MDHVTPPLAARTTRLELSPGPGNRRHGAGAVLGHVPRAAALRHGGQAALREDVRRLHRHLLRRGASAATARGRAWHRDPQMSPDT